MLQTKHFIRNTRQVVALCVAILLFVGCNPRQTNDDVTVTQAVTSSMSIPAELNSGTQLWEFDLLDQPRVDPFEAASVKAIVLVFAATDCPIANAYHPELARLYKSYSKRGIDLYLVHANREITPETARSHAADYKIELPVILDPQLEIARRVGAEVTPEAMIIQRGIETPVYRGAIDNQYAGYGKKRPVATEHYLVDAMEDVLDNKPVAVPKTNAVGCFISYEQL